MDLRRSALALASLLAVACTPPDPQKELALSDFEGYWIVDRAKGETQRIAPAVRLKLTNRGATRPIQATTTFRRKGEEQLEWGSAWLQVTTSDKPIPAGESRTIVLVSDAHYTSPGPPEEMLQHPQFKDARAEVFLRVGSSSWVKMAVVDVERRIGTRTLGDAGTPLATTPQE
jgi:hypothetical protein